MNTKKKNAFNETFMRRAIRISIDNINQNGGPFGAVIVKDGQVVAESGNRVTENLDPTAHAEIMAIRQACEKLKTFDLSGCEIYSSCEPCPMCLSAIYWARLDALYFANTKEDAKQIDFDDSFIYEQIPLSIEKRSIPTSQHLHEEALEAFRIWEAKTDKVCY
ncbi:MAG: nucleoside deaminase [Paludibacteraceae bacterium]|nr:nucleoside deaminase [Paludibacteraceae bacterium]